MKTKHSCSSAKALNDAPFTDERQPPV